MIYNIMQIKDTDNILVKKEVFSSERKFSILINVKFWIDFPIKSVTLCKSASLFENKNAA